MSLFAGVFHRFRKFAPSILNDCPSLRFVFCGNFFIEFPCDDSAMASDGQAVAKWLFIPRQDNVPKVLKCWLEKDDENLATKVEAFKSPFASASSPVNFIVSVWFPWPFADSVVPFDLSNELIREQLTLKKIDDNSRRFLLIRCPIARDESKWTKWEKDFLDQLNQIHVGINDENDIGDGLLDATLGASDQPT